MKESIERLWASFLDSPQFRRFSKNGVGQRFFRGDQYSKIQITANYFWSSYQCARRNNQFQDVETYCCFFGHNKSGTSMLGSILDAHPNAIFSDDVGALRYILAGFNRDQLYHILLKGSRREKIKGRITGRRLTAYSFQIPDQWQGRYTQLKVIGDSTSGSSTRLLGENLQLIDLMKKRMPGVNVKFIQVIRNPFDPIAISMVRGNRTFAEAFDQYFNRCAIIVDLYKKIGAENLLKIRYEDFLQEGKEHLRLVCNFLGIDAAPDYLDACASILYASPARERHMVQWDKEMIAAVMDKITQFNFLGNYSFD